MNIIILNCNPYHGNQSFDRYVDRYRVKLYKTGQYVRTYQVRDMRIDDKMPGNENPEFHRDDFRYITNALHETDLIVIASPLEQGFMTIMAKAVLDRLSHSVLPPVPMMGLILQKEPDTGEKELSMNRLVVERTAASLKTILRFCITVDSDLTEALQKTWQSRVAEVALQ